MKQLLLLTTLFLSLLDAKEYDFEITPLIGYTIPEGNIGLENYPLIGGELQYNGFDTAINPELSILYSKADYSASHLDNTKVLRVALNGVYDFEKMGPIIPLLKAGLGYEDITKSYKGVSPFIDLGIGAKIPFSDALALKFEALYMLNYTSAVDHNRKDSSLAFLAGLNFSFGERAKKVAPQQTPYIEYTLSHDDDKDGVTNTEDKCPQTPLGKLVYNDGCPESLNLNVHFANDSAIIRKESYQRIESYAKFLLKNPLYSTDIIGYTSNTGSEKHNLALSEQRAVAVKDMLVSLGVPSSKARAQGKGQENPIASNDTHEGRAVNRRIEAEMTRDQ